MKVHVHTGMSYEGGVCGGCEEREAELKKLRRALKRIWNLFGKRGYVGTGYEVETIVRNALGIK